MQGKSDLKSVRLEPRERQLLRKAARRAGMTESAFIREAVARRATEVLTDTLAARLREVLAPLHGRGPSVARRTGEAFGELLLKDEKRWRRSS